MGRAQGARVTISTVAREAGRSISTVSAALNGEAGVAPATRKQILTVARSLGYEADPRARLLRRRHTGLIGASFVAGQAFQVELIDALYVACEAQGRDLALAAVTPHRDAEQAIRALLRERCESLVVVDAAVDPDLIASVSREVPVVLLCTHSEIGGVDVVRSQDDVGMELLVEHLLTAGYRDLVHVDGGTESASRARREGFARAMASRGLEARVVSGGADEASGARAVARLMGRAEGEARRGAADLPGALVCFNDHCAVGALLELLRLGVDVPGDVAVTGYDDIPFAALSAVSLTTVRQDASQIAELAALLVGRRMTSGPELDPLIEGVLVADRPGGGVEYSVRPTLVMRRSTSGRTSRDRELPCGQAPDLAGEVGSGQGDRLSGAGGLCGGLGDGEGCHGVGDRGGRGGALLHRVDEGGELDPVGVCVALQEEVKVRLLGVGDGVVGEAHGGGAHVLGEEGPRGS